jgi:tripartite-type tricarboxylate transporter receptor subunit TctC
MLHVPYNGTGPALIGVLSGEAAVIVVPGALVPYVRSGRLRALAITSPQRSQALPDLPTVAESGLPGFEATQWYGVMAPAGTPDNVVARLNSEFVRVVRTPQMKALLIKDASIPIGSTPGELAAHLKDEIAKWAQVVKLARIRVD